MAESRPLYVASRHFLTLFPAPGEHPWAEVKSIFISLRAKKKPIIEIAPARHLVRAPLAVRSRQSESRYSSLKRAGKDGKLILVTAINPTPAGGRPRRARSARAWIGPATVHPIYLHSARPARPHFGVKGGAAGGLSQVIPMEDTTPLHRDFHAITTAHNLLSALIDNHIYWGNELGIDIRPHRLAPRHDMNDRALREIICSLGGVANGIRARPASTSPWRPR